MKRFAFLGSFVGVMALVAGCSTVSTESSEADAISAKGGGTGLCVALRGNGHYVITHFNALARIHELYGKVDTLAGGSSSSVSMFIYESMRMNKVVADCGGAACKGKQEDHRLALLLKSVRGYAEAVAITDGIIGQNGAIELVKQVQQQGVQGLLTSDPREAARRLQGILDPATLTRLGVLLNPELALLVRDQKEAADTIDATGSTVEQIAAARARLTFVNQEIHDAVSTFGNFKVDNNRLFFRPGLLSFDAAAKTTFARAADFYAGKDATGDGAVDAAGMRLFLDNCAERAVGLPWRDPDPNKPEAEKKDIEHLPMGGDFEGTETTCADFFKATTVQSLRWLTSHPIIQSRVEDVIGKKVNAIAVTSVLEGESVAKYNDALEKYRSGAYPSPQSIPFDVKFSDVKVGYWGKPEMLELLEDAKANATDLKTRKTISLGVTQWKEILKRSPAEPGLARAVPINDERISFGGWPDLAPVIALKNVGCDKVIYITRQRPESPFAIGIAKLLGMSDAEETELYDLGDEKSSFYKSIDAADAVMCTDWNAFTDGQQDEMAVEAYTSPIETTDPFFKKAGANTTARTNKAGCTPGVR